MFRSVAQPGSAPQWGCGGRRFESSHSDQNLARKSMTYGLFAFETHSRLSKIKQGLSKLSTKITPFL